MSTRLVDSPACVVADNGRMFTPELKKIFEATGQKLPEETWILEINPNHELVKKAQSFDDATFPRWAQLIFNQALLADAGTLKDPQAYVKLVNDLLLSK